MIIGVPKEIKDNEARVGVTPAGVKMLTEAGHKVLVETMPERSPAFPTTNTRMPARRSLAMPATCGASPTPWSRSRSPSSGSTPTSAKGWFCSPICISRPLPDLTDQAARVESHRHRLRNRARPPGHAAAADADERSGRPHERAGGRGLPREGTRRARHSAGRRSRACLRRTSPSSAAASWAPMPRASLSASAPRSRSSI